MAETTAALQIVTQQLSGPSRLPPIPWRDPHTVSAAKLAEYIDGLNAQCRQFPESADLRTCLGMAHAMNFDVYRSMDAFEAAIKLDACHFFAQLKYSELLYRLRTLHRAERETLKALELANNGWELSLARVQLKEIRRLLRKGNERPAMMASWGRPLLLCLGAAALLKFVLMFR